MRRSYSPGRNPFVILGTDIVSGTAKCSQLASGDRWTGRDQFLLTHRRVEHVCLVSCLPPRVACCTIPVLSEDKRIICLKNKKTVSTFTETSQSIGGIHAFPRGLSLFCITVCGTGLLTRTITCRLLFK